MGIGIKTKVVKKNNSVQEWDDNKIISAVTKSAERANVTLSDKDKEGLLSILRDILREREYISVSDLHNTVEQALYKINDSVARSYIEYRNYKLQFVKMMDEVYRKKLSLNNVQDNSNANADSSLVTTQKAITYNDLNSELYKRFFLTEEEREAMDDGYIYIHDRGSRLDSFNCCLADVGNILRGGFEMGNMHYTEPKSVDVAFDLIADIVFNMASCQYGGYTISEVDRLIAPYAEKSYQTYYAEFMSIRENDDAAKEYALKKVRKDIEQGIQGWELKFNSCSSSRGDYPFTAISFGLDSSLFGSMIASSFLKVRKEGQGLEGHKRPVLFPKLTFLYDKNLHGEGREMEWLFDEAIDCTSRAQYPDFRALTSDYGYTSSVYKERGVPISLMGCRAALSPWYEKGGMNPIDTEECKDTFVAVGRCNLGAISLHVPMIVAKAKEEGRDFFEVLDYYLQLIRKIHIRTFEFLSHKKAGTNPLAFCQGGLYKGNKDPEEEIGEEFLRPMTLSFGYTALHEATVLYKGKSLLEDNAQFAKDFLNYLNSFIAEYKKKDNLVYALYGTPAESLCFLQVKQFRKKYGIVKGVSDKEYMSNSFHLHVSENVTPIEKIDIEAPCANLSNGGNIVYTRYPTDSNLEAIKTIVRYGMEKNLYLGINMDKSYCSRGHKFLDSVDGVCPICGDRDVVTINRVCGYLGYSRIRGKSMMNDGKVAEIQDRVSM